MTTKQKQNDKREYLYSGLTQMKSVDNKGTFEGIVATNSVDRHGEIIDIMGIDTKNYMETNPIVLFGHDYWEAESVIGKALSLTKTKGGQLLSTFKLFVDDNPKALLVSKLIANGVCSLSIGFVPMEAEGNTYTKSEMVEYSVVPVPANGEAAITARSLGLTKKDMGAIKKAFGDSKIVNVDTDKGEIAVKGAIQDELDEEAAWEAKYENMEDVYDIFWAFCDVYYDQDTPVGDFSSLLGELISILTSVKDGTYVDADDDPNAVVEYTISNSMKKLGKDELKEFAKGFLAKKALKTETKSAMDDGDTSMLTQFADTLSEVLARGQALHNDMRTAVTDAGGDYDPEDQATADDGSGKPVSAPTNTVKAVEDKTEEVETAEEVVDAPTDTPVVTEPEKKALDMADIDVSDLNQLASVLKNIAVAVETKLAKADSVHATDEGTHSTVRKRRVVLREAKHEARKADKVVELILSGLKNTK